MSNNYVQLEQFNHYLDRNEDYWYYDGRLYRVSEILSAVDPVRYKVLFNEWKNMDAFEKGDDRYLYEDDEY